jgi:biotin synthase-like enzyme
MRATAMVRTNSLSVGGATFSGEQLLTTDNPDTNTDQILFKRLGINQALSNPH